MGMKIKLSFALAVILIVACGRLPESVGKSRDIAVVSLVVDTALVNSNVQISYDYPQPEPVFSFYYGADTALKRFMNFRTVFLYGSLKDKFIDRLLNAEARETTKKDQVTLFKKSDLWAKDQLVLILAVSEPQMLWNAVREYRPLISRILEDNYYRNIKAEYYKLPLDNAISDGLRKYGIAFDLHRGWMIDSSYARKDFVFIHAHYPDRSVFYYRGKKPASLSDTFAVRLRNELTKKYYNGDYIFKDLTRIEPIEFNSLKGIRMRGVWQNDSLVAGGPFLTYFLVSGDTLHVIDGILFLPGERKTDYFTRIEVLMNSFKLAVPSTKTGGGN
jgi:hypothetical protein